MIADSKGAVLSFIPNRAPPSLVVTVGLAPEEGHPPRVAVVVARGEDRNGLDHSSPSAEQYFSTMKEGESQGK